VLGLRLAGHRVALDMALRAETSFPTAHGGATIQAWRAAGELAPCSMIAAFGLCAVMRAGALRAQAEQLALPRTVTSPVFDLGLRAWLDVYRHRRWSLAVTAEAAGPFLRPRLLVDGSEVWRGWPVAVTIGLCGSARLGPVTDGAEDRQ
jgi:hypothetical protein